MSQRNTPEQVQPGEINERLFRVSAKILHLAIGHLEIHGQENIVNTPAVYLPSHRSMLDIPPVGIGLLEAGHQSPHFVVKRELWDYPVPGIGWWLNQGGALVATRDGKPHRDEADRYLEAAASKADIIIFGEGTRNKDRNSQTIGPIEPGPLFIAYKSERAIVPVGVSGTKPFYYNRVQVVFGTPIEPEEVAWLHKNRKDDELDTLNILRGKLQVPYNEAQERLEAVI